MNVALFAMLPSFAHRARFRLKIIKMFEMTSCNLVLVYGSIMKTHETRNQKPTHLDC